MIRYRCPHCASLLAAHERRVGQTSVCKSCLQPHPIPLDISLWLTETGEPLVRTPHPDGEDRGDGDDADSGRLEPTVPELNIPVQVPSASVLDLSNLPGARNAVPPNAPTPLPAPPRPAPPTHPATAHALAPPTHPAAEHFAAPPAAAAVHLQTQADIAAALTAALTSRMKPPALPRQDLRPSTAGWMLLTGLGLAFLAAGVYAEANFVVSGALVPAAALAALQVLLGYAWIVRMTYLRDPVRGLLCAVP
ncbi:MAG: hypothetical protein K2V38_27065, partial [Gemmataceae bacterium]|nr:hypothetical protein [Gemmataceae bacterium]